LQILLPLLESKDVRVQAGAAAALANLSGKKPEYAVRILHEGGCDALVPLARSEVPQVQQCAIGCFGNMIRDPQNAQSVAQIEGLVPTVAQALIRSDNASVQNVSGNCLANLATHASLRAVLREERLHLALIEAANKITDLQLLAPVARAIACMALDPETQVMIVQNKGLPAILKILRVPEEQIQQFATMALINCAANTENADAVLAEEQCIAALGHIVRTRNDQFQKMAQGVIQKLQVAKNSVVGEDVE